MKYLDHLNTSYPVRRTNEEKSAFRKYVLDLMERRGVPAKVETTGDGKNENVIIGDPLVAKVVCTAHYDTPAAALFPNIMIPRNQLLFYLYQFAPILLILAVSIGAALGIATAMGFKGEALMGPFLMIYLVLYYGLYFLLYRGFRNPNNFNDNTSGVATILSLIDKLDKEQLVNTAFILFDNEEKGKKGSRAYYKDHEKEMRSKFLVNFDCVGNGENVIFIAMKDAEQRAEYKALRGAFTVASSFRTWFYPIKGSQSNSDYKNFPCGVGCMVCKRTASGIFYTPAIHTPRDTVAKNENIEYIAGRMADFVTSL